jgi:hypothetical protein
MIHAQIAPLEVFAVVEASTQKNGVRVANEGTVVGTLYRCNLRLNNFAA